MDTFFAEFVCVTKDTHALQWVSAYGPFWSPGSMICMTHNEDINVELTGPWRGLLLWDYVIYALSFTQPKTKHLWCQNEWPETRQHQKQHKGSYMHTSHAQKTQHYVIIDRRSKTYFLQWNTKEEFPLNFQTYCNRVKINNRVRIQLLHIFRCNNQPELCNFYIT